MENADMQHDDTQNAPAATPANNGAAPMPAEQPEAVQLLLDNLPGLIGGIDWAIRDKVGQPLPFMLLVFTGAGAAHAQNFDAKKANLLVVEFARQVAASDPDAAALLRSV